MLKYLSLTAVLLLAACAHTEPADQLAAWEFAACSGHPEWKEYLY